MLFIKKNKLVTANVCMSMPDGFGIVMQDKLLYENYLRFASRAGLVKFGSVIIELSMRKAKESAIKDLQCFNAYGTRLRSEIQPITRGKGEGYGAFYKGIPGYMDLYAEKYDFPSNKQGENRFEFCVYLCAGKGKKIVQTAEFALTVPIVKQFLDSIEYK